MKRIEKTPSIIQRLQTAFGADADTTHLVVFEFIAANRLPIRKKGSVYEGAIFSGSTLAQLAAMPQQESVQVILNHNGELMPVGRVFAGEMKGDDVHVLLAINEETNPTLIKDIEAGVIDQVSVSVIPEKLTCSECGFDYMGDEANWENFFERCCNNGHKVGFNGVHLNIFGIDMWSELSLVGMGAVRGARQVSKENSAFAERANVQRLAATGLPPGALLCSNIVKQEEDPGSMPADFKELMADLTAVSKDKVALEVKLTASESKVTALTADLTARDSRIMELETQVADLTAAAAAAEGDPGVDKDTHELLLNTMKDMTTKALVATGVQNPELKADPKELIAQYEEAQSKLSAIQPGPRSKSPETDADKSNINAGQFRAYTAS